MGALMRPGHTYFCHHIANNAVAEDIEDTFA